MQHAADVAVEDLKRGQVERVVGEKGRAVGQDQGEVDKAVSARHDPASAQATADRHPVGRVQACGDVVATESHHVVRAGVHAEDGGGVHGLQKEPVAGQAQAGRDVFLTDYTQLHDLSIRQASGTGNASALARRRSFFFPGLVLTLSKESPSLSGGLRRHG